MVESLRILPKAVGDATEAYLWYEERRPGLGEEFLECVDECVNRIRGNPELFEVVHEDYRRALVRRFPYVVFYEYVANSVTVFAVFHTALDPQKWRKRIEREDR